MSNLERTDQRQVLVFTLDEPRFALKLSAVERVVRAVDITPLPKAPEIVLGVINVQGQVVPVVDIRRGMRLPARDLTLDDQFILARTSRRLVALAVDAVVGVRDLAQSEMVNAEQVVPSAEYISGMAKLADGVVLICDLDQFLSPMEERMLDQKSRRARV